MLLNDRGCRRFASQLGDALPLLQAIDGSIQLGDLLGGEHGHGPGHSLQPCLPWLDPQGLQQGIGGRATNGCLLDPVAQALPIWLG